MIRRLCNFDEATWQQLLDDDNDNLRTLNLTEHLADCDECRQRFEDMAAPADWWHESTSVLAADNTVHQSAAMSPTAADVHHSLPAAQLSQYLAPADTPDSIGRIGLYCVRRVLGSGGMGVVFEAFDATLHRNVAVKMMHPHFAVSGAARQRFGREARAAAAVVHANVVPIHAVVAEAELPYLVMSYIPGESLQERLDRVGSLELADCLSIASQIADGLAAAHAQGLVHRDIKPANILLEQGTPRVWLTDFGLARTLDDATVTASGFIAGTPQFMSPEQANGDAVDHRSDLFSLGSVLYTMVTGRPPFRADSSLAVLRRIVDHEPRPLNQVRSDTPAWLEAIVAKLQKKSPADRFADAASVRDLLRQCASHVTDPQRMPLPAMATQLTSALASQDRLRKMQRLIPPAYRWPAIIVAVCLIALVSFLMFQEPDSNRRSDKPASKSLTAKSNSPANQATVPATLPPSSNNPALANSTPSNQALQTPAIASPPTSYSAKPLDPAWAPATVRPTPDSPRTDQNDWYSIDDQLQEIRQRIQQLQYSSFNGVSSSHE